MDAVDYLWPVAFRSPVRYTIPVPYVLLFFGAIRLMGLPMFRWDPRLWLVTVATTVLLVGSMAVAMRKAQGESVTGVRSPGTAQTPQPGISALLQALPTDSLRSPLNRKPLAE